MYNLKDKVLGFIRIEGINKRFIEGDKPKDVLKDVTLSVDEGETIVLLGKSGSGKTTLLNLLSGIDLPDSGEIKVNGTAINKLNETQRTLFRRSSIGFIFQFFNLLPTLNVMENLLLPMQLNGNNNSKGNAMELLSRLGLSERAASFPDVLSGGEQQRLAIARALIHKPNIILADEPTGNLDLETGRQVIEILSKEVKSAGKTMIIATHSLELLTIADRVFKIINGTLIEMTTSDGIIN